MKRFLVPLMLSVVLSVTASVGRSKEETTRLQEKQPVRVGVYDSRAVAYAHFWTAANQDWFKTTYAKAKAAEKAGNLEEFESLKKTLKQEQRKSHRQVFSTAPVGDVLHKIEDRLPAIRKQAGVSALVSKWDEEKLKQYPSAERIDVTDLLVREFIKPTEKQQKVIEGIRKAKPVSLDQADKCD